MLKVYNEKANAKINLFLRVTGTLDGGYHALMSLMQEISLYDELEISIESDGNGKCVFECDNVSDLSTEDNLCVKACSLFRFFLGKSDVYIKLHKNIPSQAGLGGGSSDAACVLRVLQDYCGNPFTQEGLVMLAKSIGADVPFFVYGGTCICEGIGERIRKVKTLSGIPLLIVKPSEGVSTPECFKLFDSEGAAVPYREEDYEKAEAIFNSDKPSIERFKDAKKLFINDLERPAEKLVPFIADVEEVLSSEECPFYMMSGSGSAVFAVFNSKKTATEAAVKFPWVETFVCETV